MKNFSPFGATVTLDLAIDDEATVALPTSPQCDCIRIAIRGEGAVKVAWSRSPDVGDPVLGMSVLPGVESFRFPTGGDVLYLRYRALEFTTAEFTVGEGA